MERSAKNERGNLITIMKKRISEAFVLIVISLISVLIFSVGFFVLKILWPSPQFVVHKSFIDILNIIVWPIVVSFSVFFVVNSKYLREGARAVFQRISALKAGDYEVSFSVAGAKRLKRELEQTLEEFSEQSRIEYMRSARTYRVRELLRAAIEQICEVSRRLEMPDSGGIQQKHISATVHIEDVVYEESLYQLVDYVPTGGGGGRRFSIRYGSIGISFRSGKDGFWNITDPAHTTESLISDWGMTREEANHSQSYEFALCLTLKDQENKVAGLLFVKASKIEHVSGATATDDDKKDEKLKKLLEEIKKDRTCQEKLVELGNALTKVFEEVAPSGTFIRVYN